MSDPAYLNLPRCPKCRAAAGFTASGLQMRCAVCGCWWMAREEEDQQFQAARRAWAKAERPGLYGAEQEAHEAYVQRCAAAEADKVRRLREGKW